MSAHLPAPCSQGALLRTSKAWAAMGTRWPPVEVEAGLSGGSCWPLGKRRGGRYRDGQPEPLPSGSLPAAAAWLAQQRRLVWKLDLQLDPPWQHWLAVWKAGGSQSAEEEEMVFLSSWKIRARAPVSVAQPALRRRWQFDSGLPQHVGGVSCIAANCLPAKVSLAMSPCGRGML